MKKRLQKMNSIQGFSLVELLVAVLILSMVSAVVAGGIPVAKNAYQKVTIAANAQIMLSTTITALRNELCTAGDVSILDETGEVVAEATDDSGNKAEITTGKMIRYYSPAIKNYSTLSNGRIYKSSGVPAEGEEADSIILTQYADSSLKSPRRLVSKVSGDNQLYVTYDTVSYNRETGIVTFSELKVQDKDGKVFAELDESDSVIKIKLIG